MSTETTNTNNGPASIDYVWFPQPAAGPWLPASEPPEPDTLCLLRLTGVQGDRTACGIYDDTEGFGRWFLQGVPDQPHRSSIGFQAAMFETVTHYAIINPPDRWNS